MHLDAPSIFFVCVSVCLLILKFENWITCVLSPYVVSLCDFAYNVGLGVGSWPSNRTTAGSPPK